MRIKNIVDEDFVNYYKPSMFILFPSCSFKCDKENGCNLCQNSHLAQEPTLEIDKEVIIQRYIDNPLSKAFVCGGLEPFDSYDELSEFVAAVRAGHGIKDDIVIYTGYTEEEINANPLWKLITHYGNIVIKYGRFRPNEKEHFDVVLGVRLASSNQYAKRYYYEQSRK